MNEESMRLKWNSRYQNESAPGPTCAMLKEYVFLLPESGMALDLACGLGGNAVLLANHGLQTSAWDISDVAISKLADYAQASGLVLKAEVKAITPTMFAQVKFDVIVIHRFLQRELFPAVIAALAEGGLLFCQTFTMESVSECVPGNPAFKLEVNELLVLCAELNIRVFEDLGKTGDITLGLRNESFLIGQKNGKNSPNRHES